MENKALKSLQINMRQGSKRSSGPGPYASPLALGRQEDEVQFVVRDDPRVSALHCLLRVINGQIQVENRSRNGTLVGDYVLMEVGSTRVLSPGQLLQVGETLLEVKLWEPSSETPAWSMMAPAQLDHTLTALRVRRQAGGAVEVQLPQKPALTERTLLTTVGQLLQGRFVVTEEVEGALGPRWGGELNVTRSSLTFGRVADVLLDSLEVSRHHFTLSREGTRLFLEHHSTRNSTRLNGRPIVGKVELQHQDVVQAGPFTCTVQRFGNDVLVRVRGLEHEQTAEATLHALVIGRALNPSGAAMAQAGENKQIRPAPLVDGAPALAPEQEEKTLVQLQLSTAQTSKEGELRKRTAPRWVPTSDLRHDSWLGGLVGATLLGGLWVLLLQGLLQGEKGLSPGPLSSAHAAVIGERCSSCHLSGTQDVSLGCLDVACHVDATQPAPLGAGDALPVAFTGVHLSLPEDPAAHGGLPLACSTCHAEHQGAEALRQISAGRCLECHAASHVDAAPWREVANISREEVRCTACHLQHPQPGEAPLKDVTAAQALVGSDPERQHKDTLPLFSALAGLGFIVLSPLVYALWRTRQVKHQKARDEVRRAQEQRKQLPGPPKPQLPEIDPIKCVSCRKCVDACPFDALDIVEGSAKLVNKAACNGVAICAEICPTGAITMRAGDASPHQAPIQDNYESVLMPGIFLVGDLSGLSLIKNAINTGVMVAETIAQRPRLNDCQVDVAIVGAGPSGLSAGLRAAELGLRYLLLEQGSVANTLRHFPRSKLVFAQPFDVPLLGKVPMAECTKEQLLAMWDALIVRHRLRVHEEEKVLKVERRLQGGYLVTTPKGQYSAGQVVLAMGKRGTPRKLKAVGEDCEKVFYNLVDAEHFKGKRIFVYGAGDVALETALALAGQPGTEVCLGHRGDKIDMAKKRNIDKLNAAAAAGTVKVLPGISCVMEVRAKEVILQGPEGPLTLSNDVVFACIGAEMPTAWLKEQGIMT